MHGNVYVLRRIALNLHIYGGLLCFSYLIILGISVLNFNHPFAFTRPQTNETTWTQLLEVPALAKADGKTPADAMQRQNNAAIIHAMRSFAEPYPNSNGSWTSADPSPHTSRSRLSDTLRPSRADFFAQS
jgi:hypothetical protein